MYVLYSSLLFLAFLFQIPLYFIRLRVLRGERLHLKERLGWKLASIANQKKSLWIHAVSVGEVLSLQNLIKRIKEKHPDWIIHFSALTNTGIRMAKEKLQGVDHMFFAPLDFGVIVKKFIKSLKPDVFILAESEFWPNLLRQANKQTKGVLLINGRISERSWKRYKMVRPLARKSLKNIRHFLVQTEKDKEYLLKIGLGPSQIEVAGNLKSEVMPASFSEEEIFDLKESLGIGKMKKVIVAGSTRKGEEEMLLHAYAQAKKMEKDILLIIAPRHPQRADEIDSICQDLGFQVERKSSSSWRKEWDVFILDTIGELSTFYALSDIVFVGGSLVPWGGHNLLEPAFYSKPVFFGPHMENFSYLSQKFLGTGAARVVSKEKDLLDMFLLQNQEPLKEMGLKAKETLTSLHGATEKTIKVIESLMEFNQ